MTARPCQSNTVDAALWTSDSLPDRMLAAKWCAGCPLAEQRRCARTALTFKHPAGTWAGVAIGTPWWRKRLEEMAG